MLRSSSLNGDVIGPCKPEIGMIENRSNRALRREILDGAVSASVVDHDDVVCGVICVRKESIKATLRVRQAVPR